MYRMRSARYERLLAVMDESIKQPVLRYQTISTVMGLEYLEAVRMGTPLSPPGPHGAAKAASAARQRKAREASLASRRQ